MEAVSWVGDNFIEVFGVITGIIYVLLEIRQNIWLWPLGIVTSTVYIWVFYNSKFYADMSLQVYYLVISVLGWYWWVKGRRWEGIESEGRRDGEKGRAAVELTVTRLRYRTGIFIGISFIILYAAMWTILSQFTDSPVPGWDSFITSLSIVATWMLARKIYEHWYLWVIVNISSAVIFIYRGLYPTVILYVVYGIMSFAGMSAWRKDLRKDQDHSSYNK